MHRVVSQGMGGGKSASKSKRLTGGEGGSSDGGGSEAARPAWDNSRGPLRAASSRSSSVSASSSAAKRLVRRSASAQCEQPSMARKGLGLPPPLPRSPGMSPTGGGAGGAMMPGGLSKMQQAAWKKKHRQAAGGVGAPPPPPPSPAPEPEAVPRPEKPCPEVLTPEGRPPAGRYSSTSGAIQAMRTLSAAEQRELEMAEEFAGDVSLEAEELARAGRAGRAGRAVHEEEELLDGDARRRVRLTKESTVLRDDLSSAAIRDEGFRGGPAEPFGSHGSDRSPAAAAAAAVGTRSDGARSPGEDSADDPYHSADEGGGETAPWPESATKQQPPPPQLAQPEPAAAAAEASSSSSSSSSSAESSHEPPPPPPMPAPTPEGSVASSSPQLGRGESQRSLLERRESQKSLLEQRELDRAAAVEAARHLGVAALGTAGYPPHTSTSRSVGNSALSLPAAGHLTPF